MNRSLRLYLIVFGLILGLIVVLQLNKRTPIDWHRNFSVTEKSPFGLYVLNQELDQLFDRSITRVQDPIYPYLQSLNTNQPQNLLLIQEKITWQALEKALDLVEKEAYNLMIISEISNHELEKKLELSTKYHYSLHESHRIEFTDKRFQNKSLDINLMPGTRIIHKIDSLNTTILGNHRFLENEDEVEFNSANFVQIQYGEGKVFYHTQPIAFTNYYLLENGNEEYASTVFSYLPDYPIIWFQPSQFTQSSSPVRLLFDYPSLKYAWYLLLASLALFVFFTAKRKQRTVPIIKPPVNSSAEFVRTIGNFYLQESNYKDMAQKKSQYFLNRVRNELLLDTHELNDAFAKKLHIKTNQPLEKIQQAIALMRKALHPEAPVHEIDLIKLNQLLDEIYQ
ncbi:MAG: hypothetical protein Q4F57_08165 [Weeksellaceae bacterium]|nr:hypothetical protein [Weeksellaceae bacterium]